VRFAFAAVHNEGPAARRPLSKPIPNSAKPSKIQARPEQKKSKKKV
jgi:hypothetical protein